MCERIDGPTKSISHFSNDSNDVTRNRGSSSLQQGFSDPLTYITTFTILLGIDEE
jgi:hypothetical protein